MQLAILGTGYVGLVAGAGFAETGNDVVCVDVDPEKVARLQRGEVPIYEPGLPSLVERNAKAGRLSFSTDVAAAVAPAEVVFLAVGTPSAHDGSADLSQVLEAATTVARAMKGYAVIVTKSTVPVGTADKLTEHIKQHTQHPFAVVSNPEFLKEGDAINDFMKPDRVIIGTRDPKAEALLRHLYEPFVRTNDRICVMDARSAELTKYASNAMLATRISFMNEMANLCDRVGADVELVRRGLGMDQRIGPKFLFPGVGYGGSCFPKDVKAALATAREAGMSLEVLDAVHRVNEKQKQLMFDKLLAHFTGGLAGRTIALWGLSFKPGTDDIREAPALVMIDRLLAAGATVHGHDPEAMSAVRAQLGDRVRLFDDQYEATVGASALVLMTEWNQYRRPNWKTLKGKLSEAVVFDGRNIWEPRFVRERGFVYYGVGRDR